ncbi:hybrid sensor histidine kinase/response regulator [Cognaticolwellia mytili]|uniref:hybrid sensor histidine kinase/response regulator n=1 Tax=Cognaticolwellia mytili TaxID=1888913 RepID=UPI000A170A76|nr:hybrid sensor histidine kinase/response regulator [Cognaticolwellia mytili]
MLDPILIVDESRLVREAIAKILLSCGVNKSAIACIENMDDAFEFAQFSPISLLICSDSYSDRNPRDFREQLVGILTTKALPLLILSQRTLDESKVPATPSFKVVQNNSISLYKPFKRQHVISALFALTQYDKFTPIVSNTTPEKIIINEAKITKPSILVVDDESSNIDVAAGNLRQYYQVIAAKSGEHALKIINNGKQKIELVLLDIMMPEMDGYQVCSMLKKNPKTTNIPIIFLSAKSEVADMKYGFELGAVDYITKPLNGDLLRARVATHMRLQQQNTALAEQVMMLQENAKLQEDIEKITQHDLKGPLNNILFETYRLTDKAAANSINKAVNNVVDMINNSLNLYKIEQDIYQLTPQRINLNQMINDAINAVSRVSKEKSLNITLTGFEQTQYIYAEPLLCLSIFNNLIKNAVEASQNSDSIMLSLAYEKGYVTFQVINNGVIPKALRATLFNKYTSSNHQTGTGLGTYSAKLMTEVQHGEIYFDIINEQQTLFVVKLPSA